MSHRAVVTGANRGIGLELCRQLRRTHKVLGVCREASPELKSLEVEVLSGADVKEASTPQKIKDYLGQEKIGLFIHNAGIFKKESLQEIDLDPIREQMEVNAFAPLRLTAELASQMQSPSKIVMITSRMGSIEDNTSGGYYGYRMSKAALNMAAKSLSLDLKDQKIGVYLFHPGFVRTGMTSQQGDIEADEAASRIIKKLDTLGLSETGRFYHSNGESLPW